MIAIIDLQRLYRGPINIWVEDALTRELPTVPFRPWVGGLDFSLMVTSTSVRQLAY